MCGLHHWANGHAVTEMGQCGGGVEEPRGTWGTWGGQEMPTSQLDMSLEFRVQRQHPLCKYITKSNTCNRILPLSSPDAGRRFLVPRQSPTEGRL